MKNQLLLLTMLTFTTSQTIAAGIDFSGQWQGLCTLDGRQTPSSLIIKKSPDSITLNEQEFSLTSTTIRHNSGFDEGREFNETTVYDWRWNDDKTSIVTNARWLGWFINFHGAWTGFGTGHIKIQNSKLETFRNVVTEFDGNTDKYEEHCLYEKQK